MLFHILIFRLAISQTKPPSVIVDDDADMIGIVEGCCATIKGGVIEVPFRRSNLPDELGKLLTVFFVSHPTPFCLKIKLVPPLPLRLLSQRHFAAFLAP